MNVNIPGVGTVTFPDSMTPAEVQHAIETDILPNNSVRAQAGASMARRQSGGDLPAGYTENDMTNPGPTTAGGVVSQQAGNFGSRLGQLAGGMAKMIVAPSPIVLPNQNATVGIIKSHLSEAGRAADAYRGGNYASGVEHSIRAAVPVIGPMVGGMVDQADAGNLGGAVADVAALEGPKLAAEAMPSVGRFIGGGSGPAKQYAGAVDPRGTNPARMAVAQRMVDEGVTMGDPRAQLADIGEAKANAVDTKTPILNRQQPAAVQSVLDEITAARDRLYNVKGQYQAPADPQPLIKALKAQNPGAEVFDDGNGSVVVRTIRHPEMQPTVDALHSLERHIKQTASDTGTVPNDTLANLHSDYNYFADKEGAFDHAQTNPDRLPPNAHVAKAISNVVNQDPAAAGANAEKTIWLDAKGMAPNAQAGGNLFVLTMKGFKAVTGGGLSKVQFVKDVMMSPRFKTVSAVTRSNFAKAVSAQDWNAVGQIGAQIVAGDEAAADN